MFQQVKHPNSGLTNSKSKAEGGSNTSQTPTFEDFVEPSTSRRNKRKQDSLSTSIHSGSRSETSWTWVRNTRSSTQQQVVDEHVNQTNNNNKKYIQTVSTSAGSFNTAEPSTSRESGHKSKKLRKNLPKLSKDSKEQTLNTTEKSRTSPRIEKLRIRFVIFRVASKKF